MAKILLGQHPDELEVRLVRGDKAVLVATLTDAAGAPVPWSDAPSLQFADGRTRVVIDTFEAVVAGAHATWTLTPAEVEEVAAASPRQHGTLNTMVRLTVPDAVVDPEGSVEYVGPVVCRTGGSRATGRRGSPSPSPARSVQRVPTAPRPGPMSRASLRCSSRTSPTPTLRRRLPRSLRPSLAAPSPTVERSASWATPTLRRQQALPPRSTGSSLRRSTTSGRGRLDTGW